MRLKWSIHDLHMGLLKGFLYKILLKFSKKPKEVILVVFYSLKPFKWHMTHDYLSCMMYWHLAVCTYSTKSTSSIMKIFFCIYQQITQHYLGVYQIGYIHCKFQTLSFQMTLILSWLISSFRILEIIINKWSIIVFLPMKKF